MSEALETVGPAADPRIRKAVKQQQDERDRQLADDSRFVFSSRQGQRFIAALIAECGLYSASPDMGKRSVAVGLRAAAIKLDPKFWSAIEADILARRIVVPTRTKEDPDE